MTFRFGIALVTVKGVIIAAVLRTIIAPPFLQTLAVAVCSATVSGVFLLIATHMNTRRNARPVERVKELVEARLDGQEDATDG